MNSTNSVNEQNKTHGNEQEPIEIRFYDIYRNFLKFWWLCLILSVVCAGMMFYKSYIRFIPTYQSSVTFTVHTQELGSGNIGITSYSFSYNRSTATQLSATFPNIIKSNILQDIICNDLGITSFPFTLSASSVTGTNMFTITATGYDAEMTYTVLQSVIKNYPAVAEYVIGNTVLTILNEPEIPTSPSNQFAYRGQTLRGAIIGFAAGIALIALYTIMRQTIRSRDDIRHKLNQTCLGVLPEVTFHKHKKDINRTIALNNPLIGEGYLESFRALRNTLLNALNEDQKIILVTSAAPGEGKTSAATNLAASLASMKKNVLIVDSDLRNPNVVQRFQITQSTLDAEDVHRAKITKLQITKTYSLSILHFNTARYKIWDILELNYIEGLFEQLRQKYDYIIIDTSPLGITSEPSVIAQVADAAVLVVKQDTIRTSRLISVIDTLLSSDIPLLGCILNNASSDYVGYGSKYGYRYRHYGKYGYGRYGYGYAADDSEKDK